MYKAYDLDLEENVALKLVNPEIASDEKTILRFLHELKIARKISHKNVSRVFDLGKENDEYYFTMEYVSGEDLKSSIKRVYILLKSCCALLLIPVMLCSILKI